jgi:hypothetical protein
LAIVVVKSTPENAITEELVQESCFFSQYRLLTRLAETTNHVHSLSEEQTTKSKYLDNFPQ